MNKRKLALQLLPLFTDGRPSGCTCPPDPGSNALPCDNKHIASSRCKLTPKPTTTDLEARVAQLELSLSLLAEGQHQP